MKRFFIALVMFGAASCGTNNQELSSPKDARVRSHVYSTKDEIPVPRKRVIPVPENSKCRADLNQYGNPSRCSCPEGYGYDAVKFVCKL